MAANPTADPKMELFDPLSGKAFRGHHGLRVSHYGVFCVECRMSVASSPSSLQRHLKKHPSWELIISLQDLKNLCSKHIEELKHNQDIRVRVRVRVRVRGLLSIFLICLGKHFHTN